MSIAKTPKKRLRSVCPTAAALDVIGDRWSLVLLRDILLHGSVRFSQLKQADEGIAANILTDRLRHLESEGLIVARPYSERLLRYEYLPTAKSRDLVPVLEALAKWGQKHVRGVSMDWLELS